jgi:hypothetical protein
MDGIAMTIAEYIEHAKQWYEVTGRPLPSSVDAKVQIGADVRVPMNDPSFKTAADAARRQLASNWLSRGGLGIPIEEVSEVERLLPMADRVETVVAIDWKAA